MQHGVIPSVVDRHLGKLLFNNTSCLPKLKSTNVNYIMKMYYSFPVNLDIVTIDVTARSCEIN